MKSQKYSLLRQYLMTKSGSSSLMILSELVQNGNPVSKVGVVFVSLQNYVILQPYCCQIYATTMWGVQCFAHWPKDNM